jgi:hypothetical protein
MLLKSEVAFQQKFRTQRNGEGGDVMAGRLLVLCRIL